MRTNTPPNALAVASISPPPPMEDLTRISAADETSDRSPPPPMEDLTRTSAADETSDSVEPEYTGPITRSQRARLISPAPTLDEGHAEVLLPQEPHQDAPENEVMNMEMLATHQCCAFGPNIAAASTWTDTPSQHREGSVPTPFGVYNLCMPIMGEAHLTAVKSRVPEHVKSRYSGVEDPYSLIGKVPASQVELDLPPDYRITRRYPLYKLCLDGKHKEMQSLLDRQCFGFPCAKPAGAKSIGLLWVNRAKPFESGPSTGMLKAIKMRLTLMGNQERTVLDKVDAYAPVANRASYLVVISTYLGEKAVTFQQMDVVQAYLSSAMKRLVYVKHPPGFMLYKDDKGRLSYRQLELGERPPETVMRLRLALYGGMECGRLFWNLWVGYHVDTLGFKQMHYDQCVLRKEEQGSFIILVFHVDDSLVVRKGEAMWERYQRDLGKRLEVTISPLQHLLGTRIRLDAKRGIAVLDQEQQIRKTLSVFGFDGPKVKRVTSPMPKGVPTAADVPKDKRALFAARAKFDFAAFVGHANWLQQGTRPGLSLALKICSKFMRAWGEAHIVFAHHVLRWLASTASMPLVLRSGYDLGIQIFTDASHASDPDTRRSILGILVKVAGNTVAWSAIYSRIVSHSSCESELMALDRGVTIGQFVKWLLELTTRLNKHPMGIFVDNQATLDLSSNPIQPGRNLHIHARYFYVRDLYVACAFALCKIKSSQQVADVLVTFKGGDTFNYLLRIAMGCALAVLNEETDEFEWDLSQLI